MLHVHKLPIYVTRLHINGIVSGLNFLKQYYHYSSHALQNYMKYYCVILIYSCPVINKILIEDITIAI